MQDFQSQGSRSYFNQYSINENKAFPYADAIYREQEISIYKGNKFIEALPPIISDVDCFYKIATFIPEIDSHDMTLGPALRRHLDGFLTNFFVANYTHFFIEQQISKMIRQGYYQAERKRTCPRLMLDEDTANMAPYGIAEPVDMTVAAFTLMGVSGLGKSRVIERILGTYPKVIRHTHYKEKKFVEYQVPYLKVEVAPNSDIKSLGVEICKAVDRLFPGHEQTHKEAETSAKKQQVHYINKVLSAHNVGLLIIDEVQNLAGMSDTASETILNFFMLLQNTISTPLVLVGTPDTQERFQRKMKHARRVADSICLEPYKNDSQWCEFVSGILRLQFTDVKINNVIAIASCLHQESLGIPDIAIKLMKHSMVHALDIGASHVTPEIIKRCAKDRLSPLNPIITAVKTGDWKKVRSITDLTDMDTLMNQFLDSKLQHHARQTQGNYSVNHLNMNDYRISVEIESTLINLGFNPVIANKACMEVLKECGTGLPIEKLSEYAYQKADALRKDAYDVYVKKRDDQSTTAKKAGKTRKTNLQLPNGEMVDRYDAEKNGETYLQDGELTV